MLVLVAATAAEGAGVVVVAVTVVVVCFREYQHKIAAIISANSGSLLA